MNYSNDDFIRTTEDRHKRAVQALCGMNWSNVMKFISDKYAGWYAVRDEAYYGEDELRDGQDGTKIAPSGAEVQWVEEESYFFRLSKWGDRIVGILCGASDFVMPEGRFNEVKSFVKSGLKDLSVSRTTFDWGVKVPGNEKHVMYVWIDALTNYITALGYPEKTDEMKHTGQPPFTWLVRQFCDFHAIYWPAFLMAAELPLPKRIFAHGWWTIEGEKMSKSLGNVIAPHDLVEKYGLDQSRYFMLREVPFGSDGDFSHEQAINRINAGSRKWFRQFGSAYIVIYL